MSYKLAIRQTRRLRLDNWPTLADKNHNRVVKVLAANGSQTTVGTGLLQPNSVAVDSAGDVFISDAGNQRVVEVPVGDGGQSIVYDGSADGENLTQITADGPGNLFILTSTENSPGNSVTNRSFWVVKIPAGGGAETTVFTGNSSEDPIEVSGNYPVSTAVDGAGNLYVGVLAYSESPYSGFQADSVVEIQAVGSVQTNVLVNGYPPDVLPDLSPFQMALDQSGNLFLNYSWLSLSIIEDARSLPPRAELRNDRRRRQSSVSVGRQHRQYRSGDNEHLIRQPELFPGTGGQRNWTSAGLCHGFAACDRDGMQCVHCFHANHDRPPHRRPHVEGQFAEHRRRDADDSALGQQWCILRPGFKSLRAR